MGRHRRVAWAQPIGLMVAASLLGCSEQGVTPPSVPPALTGKIAYVNGSTLLVSDYDSNRLAHVVYSIPTGTSGVHSLRWVVWGPDGRTLAFGSVYFTLWDPDTVQLQIVNASGSGVHGLGVFGAPAFTADGRFAYHCSNNYGASIYGQCLGSWIIVDGVRIYPAGVVDSRPAFSPDGRFLVAFKRDSATSWVGGLYRVDLSDTSATLPLAEGPGAPINPIYSPTGDRIAYIRQVPGIPTSAEIWVMDADGKNQNRITLGHEDDWPTWSPDGTMIAFERLSAPAPGIYVVPALGGEATLIIPDGRYPSWHP